MKIQASVEERLESTPIVYQFAAESALTEKARAANSERIDQFLAMTLSRIGHQMQTM